MNINFTESSGLYRGCRFGCYLETLEDATDTAQATVERALILDDGDDDIDDIVSYFTEWHTAAS